MVTRNFNEQPGLASEHRGRSVPPLRDLASDEGDLAKIRLRAALARERSLIRQMEQLVRDQEEVLRKLFAGAEDAANRVARLSPRERQIMELILAGNPNKTIAADLGISRRTVESHRAAIMRKTGSKSLPALARLAIAASGNDGAASGNDGANQHPCAAEPVDPLDAEGMNHLLGGKS